MTSRWVRGCQPKFCQWPLLSAIPGTALSSGHWQNFGWQPRTHRLVIAAGPNNQPRPAQLAYWQPGSTRLRVATIHNPVEASNLQTGNIG